MLKKIILSLIFIPLVAGGVWLYLWYREQKTPISNALNAIPSNTSFIIETRQAKQAWKKLSETSIIWSDLLATQFFYELNRSGRFIDSLLSSNEEAYPMLEDRPVFISAHLSGARNFDFLYTFSLPELSKESVIRALILGSTRQNETLPSRVYDDGEIHAVKFIPSNRIFYYTVHKGIFSGSFSGVLVEDAIRQLNSGTTIISNKDFAKVMNTAGEKVDANIYINYKSFPDILQTFLKPSTESSMDFFTGFASWSELDLNMKPNALLLNGYTYADAQARHYLTLFTGQKPQQIELSRIVPANASTLLFYGVSDFRVFHRNYKSWLERQGRLQDYNKAVSEIRSTYGVSAEQGLLSWVDNEFALVVTEPSEENEPGSNAFAVMRSNRIREAVKVLTGLCDTIGSKQEKRYDTTGFRGFTIREFPLPKLPGILLGEPFTSVKATCFTVVEDYIVFGSSTASLQVFLNDYGSGRTLAKNNYYREFTKDNLSAEANIYLYSNIARSTSLYKKYVREDYEKDIDQYLDLFRKFEAVGIQVSSDKNMFYNNIYLKHNPIYKKESTSLWETTLDTTVHQRPWLVTNHNNQAKEVFVQDNANTIYLISNTGKVLWKRTLAEPIIGEVMQVDALKNKKLQLLFNTRSAIYLVDRNGKDVEGFPVKLPSPATNGISVFDYDNSRDYRILVACADKKVYNFMATGKEAAKWNYEPTGHEVRCPIRHFTIGSKDYLAAVDSEGKVYITTRRGEKVLKPKEHLPFNTRQFYILAGKDLGSTRVIASDTDGTIHKLPLQGEQEEQQFRAFEGAVQFEYIDLNHDGTGEFVFSSGNLITVYGQDKNQQWEHIFPKPLSAPPAFYKLAGKKIMTGTVHEQSNEVYLLDENGKPAAGSPFTGATSFSIGDLNNDGTLNLVTGSGKTIYVYVLQ